MKTTKDKRFLVLTTLICLLPIAMYLVAYQYLPEDMRVTWGVSAIRTLPRPIAIFVLPVALALVHLLVAFLTQKDPRKENASMALQHLVGWIVPVVSIFVNTIVLLSNTGAYLAEEAVLTLTLVFVGLTFIVAGNYLPKSRPNQTIGLPLPWILNDVDNWKKTHRLAGKLMIFGGFLFIVGAVLPLATSTTLVLILMLSVGVFCLVVPIVYSLALHGKKDKA